VGHPVVVGYLAEWPQRAAALIATLRRQLGVLPERIEHTGKRLWPRREHPDGGVDPHVRGAGSPNERLALVGPVRPGYLGAWPGRGRG
jgi:hypothetical protein